MAEAFYIMKCFRIDEDENIEELIEQTSSGLKVADYTVYRSPTDENQKCIKIYYLRD